MSWLVRKLQQAFIVSAVLSSSCVVACTPSERNTQGATLRNELGVPVEIIRAIGDVDSAAENPVGPGDRQPVVVLQNGESRQFYFDDSQLHKTRTVILEYRPQGGATSFLKVGAKEFIEDSSCRLVLHPGLDPYVDVEFLGDFDSNVIRDAELIVPGEYRATTAIPNQCFRGLIKEETS